MTDYFSDTSMPLGDRLREAKKHGTTRDLGVDTFMVPAFTWLDKQSRLWDKLFTQLLPFVEAGHNTLPFHWLEMKRHSDDSVQFQCSLHERHTAHMFCTRLFQENHRREYAAIVGVCSDECGTCIGAPTSLWPTCNDDFHKWYVFLFAMLVSHAARNAFCSWMHDRHHCIVEEVHNVESDISLPQWDPIHQTSFVNKRIGLDNRPDAVTHVKFSISWK